jgi:hypothetical protein
MYKAFIFILLILLIIFYGLRSVEAQTGSFTYQGSLKDGANAASGNYDMTVEIYDAETGGNLVGSTNFTNVAVAGGIFSLNIAGAQSVFPGAARYLQLKVKRSGTNDFTTLSPRQLVTSSPYAIKSLNAVTADNALQIGGLSANQLVQTNDARLSDARPPTPGSTSYIQNSETLQPNTSFNIGGNGLLNGYIRAGNINSAGAITANGYGYIGGTLYVGTFSSPIGYKAIFVNTSSNGLRVETQTEGGKIASFGGYGNFEIDGGGVLGGRFIVKEDGNVGIGIATPQTKLHVVGQDIRIQSSQPSMYPRYSMVFSGGATDSKKWQNYANNNGLVFSALNDAENMENPWLKVNRLTGTNIITSVEFPTSFVRINQLVSGGSNSICRDSGNQLATCSSSIRYKQNIQDYKPGLELIKKLRPVSFNWKADNREDMGLVAEEVAAVEPLLTTTNEKGEIEGVKYDRVGVVLINAVREQQAQIEALQKQNSELKERVEMLERVVRQLNQQPANIQSKVEN